MSLEIINPLIELDEANVDKPPLEEQSWHPIYLRQGRETG